MTAKIIPDLKRQYFSIVVAATHRWITAPMSGLARAFAILIGAAVDTDSWLLSRRV